MTNRKQKVEELMERIHAMKRQMTIGASSCTKMPRITPAQWGVVVLIEQRNGSTVKDIATALGVTSSAATQLVDGLVASGYVTRKQDPKDRRRVTLMLSVETKRHVSQMKEQVSKRLLKFFKILDDKEFDQYIRLNEKLSRALLKKN